MHVEMLAAKLTGLANSTRLVIVAAILADAAGPDAMGTYRVVDVVRLIGGAVATSRSNVVEHLHVLARCGLLDEVVVGPSTRRAKRDALMFRPNTAVLALMAEELAVLAGSRREGMVA